MRPRVTILGLMVAVLFVAVGLAALRDPSDFWLSVAFSSACAILLVATLLAVRRTGACRAWWVGFALFGWAYLVASRIPRVEPLLLTTRGLDRAAPGLFPSRTLDVTRETDPLARAPFFRPDGSSRPGVVLGIRGRTGELFATQGGVPEQFRPVGHSLLTVVLGLVGALTSRLLAAKDRHRPPDPPRPNAGGDHLSRRCGRRDGDAGAGSAGRDGGVETTASFLEPRGSP